jgi:hypothetical protein
MLITPFAKIASATLLKQTWKAPKKRRKMKPWSWKYRACSRKSASSLMKPQTPKRMTHLKT